MKRENKVAMILIAILVINVFFIGAYYSTNQIDYLKFLIVLNVPAIITRLMVMDNESFEG